MKMTIGKKLFGGFFAVLAILAVIVGVAYYQISNVDDTYTNLIDDRVAKMLEIRELDVVIKQEQVGLRGYLIVGDATALDTFSNAREQYRKRSDELFKSLTNQTNKDLLKEVDAIENEYFQFAQKAILLKQQNKIDEYTRLIDKDGRKLVGQFDDKIEKLAAYQSTALAEGDQGATAKVESIKTLILTLGILSLVIGVMISIFLGRIISKPVVNISGMAKRISEGDLTVDEVKVKNKDEIGELAHSFNQMSHNLRELIHQVGLNAEQVAASSEQLTASAEQTTHATEQITETMQDVADGVNKQVHSVEETSQTINEMAIGIQQIAQNAQNVSSTAIDATERASEGGQILEKATGQMNSINETVNGLSIVIKGLGERSKEIDQIIEVITGIAAQTNLLALNAAIEAARAGENGRGFAVVADEVRKLAEQSAHSAQQISQLISSIQEETNKAVDSIEETTNEVVSGIGIVNTAGESFKHIERTIIEVTTQIQEVSSAVQQMAAGSEQMSHSMQTITDVSAATSSGTQGVSASIEEQLASMEEITSSADALSNMAEELQKLVGRFKI
ncbi:methyl-accepting chemotaxis protein [Cytobacillus eiseniae]|uniref:Methyl-accepting chemotaxis protein n=1 Tax=Cytobacillus eiseniae TaxID=762947 RepID=A0ABS4RHY2_9BACI|nr:methyl-accepting chemotaxis protein [Cytobacillus eiseniae]MBP2242363.1 methyl-accepting chemotaxis protein [Cytobacillus eiseniae]